MRKECRAFDVAIFHYFVKIENSYGKVSNEISMKRILGKFVALIYRGEIYFVSIFI